VGLVFWGVFFLGVWVIFWGDFFGGRLKGVGVGSGRDGAAA
jgi:hypothetical protein